MARSNTAYLEVPPGYSLSAILMKLKIGLDMLRLEQLSKLTFPTRSHFHLLLDVKRSVSKHNLFPPKSNFVNRLLLFQIPVGIPWYSKLKNNIPRLFRSDDEILIPVYSYFPKKKYLGWYNTHIEYKYEHFDVLEILLLSEGWISSESDKAFNFSSRCSITFYIQYQENSWQQ